MLRNRALIVPMFIACCLLVAAPIYACGANGCAVGCTGKDNCKSTCVKTSSADAQKESGSVKASVRTAAQPAPQTAAGCSRPCTTPCGSKGAHSAFDGKASKLIFGVAHMHCGGCARAVGNAIKTVKGVRSVAVDHSTGVADVEFDDGAASPASVIEALEKAGYRAKVGPYSDQELAEFAKRKEAAGSEPKDM